jgi:hypothetical protein
MPSTPVRGLTAIWPGSQQKYTSDVYSNMDQDAFAHDGKFITAVLQSASKVFLNFSNQFITCTRLVKDKRNDETDVRTLFLPELLTGRTAVLTSGGIGKTCLSVGTARQIICAGWRVTRN